MSPRYMRWPPPQEERQQALVRLRTCSNCGLPRHIHLPMQDVCVRPPAVVCTRHQRLITALAGTKYLALTPFRAQAIHEHVHHLPVTHRAQKRRLEIIHVQHHTRPSALWHAPAHLHRTTAPVWRAYNHGRRRTGRHPACGAQHIVPAEHQTSRYPSASASYWMRIDSDR